MNAQGLNTLDECVIFERIGNVAVISLNRPARRNAIDAAASEALGRCVDLLENDATLAVGILRGRGPVFCSGMDLRAFADGQADAILFGEGGFAGFVRRSRTKPIIAAVHGSALAGGFELMLACDLVVATASCQFGLPEARRGLIAGGGGAMRLGQSLPRAIANEILLLGEAFDAATAQRLGLINRVVADEDVLHAASLSMAEALAKNAPLSIAANLTMVNAASRRDTAGQWELSNSLLRRLVNSSDALEGARAFAEKRPAVWRSR